MNVETFILTTTLFLWVKQREVFIEGGFQIFEEWTSTSIGPDLVLRNFDPNTASELQYAICSVQVSIRFDPLNVDQLRILDDEGYGNNSNLQELFRKAGYIKFDTLSTGGN